MSDTLPLVLLKAIETALGVASVTTNAGTVVTKPTGLTVTRFQARPKSGARVMVVKAADMGDKPSASWDLEGAAFRQLEGEFFADVVCFADGDPPEDAVDALVRWAHLAVLDTFAGDRFLSGNALLAVPVAVDYGLMRANDNEAAAAVRFRMLYHAAADDPALKV